MRFNTVLLAIASLSVFCPAEGAENPPPKNVNVYVGTYTGGKSKGIYLCRMDCFTGKLSEPELVAQTRNPSFLALNPAQDHLYCVGELWDASAGTGTVSAYAIERNGKLKFINQQSSGAKGPCHLTLDSFGKTVLVANYAGGAVAALPVDDNGGLKEPSCVIKHEGKGPNPKRQEAPHVHSVNLSKTGVAMVCDLGLDRIFLYRLDVVGRKLAPNDPPFVATAPGAGPRHLTRHPLGDWVYVVNEMGNTVTVYQQKLTDASLQEIQTVGTLPEDFKGQNTTAEVAVNPEGGHFLYASNRGHDSLAVFRVDADTGKLTPVGHVPSGGKTPRNFAIDPGGRFLIAANQDSNNLVVFAIDGQTGMLKQMQEIKDIGSPVCVRFATNQE